MTTPEDQILFDNLPGLQALGNNIYSYDPPDTPSISIHASTPRRQYDPSLVILCTWLGGATARRISKYLTMYRSLFPRSAILLIRTTFPDLSIYTFARIRARLEPARDVVRRIDGNGGGGMLLHMFSNGGSNIGVQLTLSLLQSSSSSTTFPLRATIHDCSPGPATFPASYHSASYSIPSGFVSQIVGRAALYPASFVMFNLQTWGLLASIDDLRADLNDPDVFPLTVPRLYLYSEGDRVVGPKDVEMHIQKARRKGYEVVAERFGKWEHCALVLDERYGGVIRRFWEGVAGGEWVEDGRTVGTDEPVVLKSKL